MIPVEAPESPCSDTRCRNSSSRSTLFGRSSRATLCQVGPESRVNHVESSREKPFDRHGAPDKILRELPTVTGILWIPHPDATARPPAQAASRTAVRWQEAIACGSLATGRAPAGGPPAVETTFVGAVGATTLRLEVRARAATPQSPIVAATTSRCSLPLNRCRHWCR